MLHLFASLRPDRLPHRLRLTAYGFAVAVLLYLTLAPAEDLPRADLWDKAEHASAWFVLAAIGLAFWPARPRRIAGFALVLGALVEVLQWAVPFGRDADLRDLLADGVGMLVALAAWFRLRSPGPRASRGRATAG